MPVEFGDTPMGHPTPMHLAEQQIVRDLVEQRPVLVVDAGVELELPLAVVRTGSILSVWAHWP